MVDGDHVVVNHCFGPPLSTPPSTSHSLNRLVINEVATHLIAVTNHRQSYYYCFPGMDVVVVGIVDCSVLLAVVVVVVAALAAAVVGARIQPSLLTNFVRPFARL